MGWLDDAEERADAATEGPWDNGTDGEFDNSIWAGDDLGGIWVAHVIVPDNPVADAAFIASVREDAPRAYALIRQLGDALEEIIRDIGGPLKPPEVEAARAFREATEDR